MTLTDTRPDTLTAPTESAPAPLDSITLPYRPETLAGIYAAAQAASKDDVTPIITTVLVSPRTFIATDRYTVAEWSHTMSDADEADGVTNHPDASVMVPRTAAEWLAKQTTKVLANVTATKADIWVIEFTPTRIAIKWAASGEILALHTFGAITGSFPPVARLFPDESGWAVDAMPIALAPEHLNKIIRAITKAGEKNEAIRFRFTATSSGRPGPVVATFGTRYRALIQPNLITR